MRLLVWVYSRTVLPQKFKFFPLFSTYIQIYILMLNNLKVITGSVYVCVFFLLPHRGDQNMNFTCKQMAYLGSENI